MADKGKSYRTQIIVAVIGLIGVLATALIANWDKIFTPEGTSKLTESTARQPNERLGGVPSTRPALTIAEAQREAEKVTARWVEAWQAGDVTTLVELSIPPFFLDNEILISVSDVRSKYQVGAQEPKGGQFTIDRIMSGSIAEYKRLGYVNTNDRLLSRMQLSDDALVVILIVSGEGIGFYFRRLGDRVEMAGFWD